MSESRIPWLLAAGLLGQAAAAWSAEPAVPEVLQRDPRPLAPTPLLPADGTPLYNDFVGLGLLQTPSARMAPEGQIALGINRTAPYRRYGVGFQVLPWLEATLRYTLVDGIPAVAADPGSTYTDKSVDLRARLLTETRWRPAVAVGLRDLAGTGLFDSEYVVASKRTGSLDWSIGLATGNLGERGDVRNPLCASAARFCERDQGFRGAGNVEITRLFTGPVGVFGGVAWQTPWQPLRVVAELDGNSYRREFLPVNLSARNRLNGALVYAPTEGVQLTAGVERGDTAVLGITLHTNLNRLRQPKLDTLPPPLGEPVREPVANDTLAKALRQDAGLNLLGVARTADAILLQVSHARYRDPAEARQRAWRVLQRLTPVDTERFTLVELEAGVPQVESEATRTEVVRAFTPSDDPVPVQRLTTAKPVSTARLAGLSFATLPQPPGYSYLAPYFQQSFGGIDTFFAYDFGVRAGAGLAWGGTRLDATVLASVANNYDRFTSPPDTAALPPVRTRVREYLKDPLRLESLTLSQVMAPHRDWLAQAYAGQLELMFAGVGGEILYRPAGSRWGLGLDVNAVRQRVPTQLLGLEDYRVTTGHLTWYQQWDALPGLMTQVAVGRYLGGDVGGTLQVSRRFDSGIVVGAFAAKTNVSAAEFGEGSFHKGFFLNIPLDLLWVRHARRSLNTTWVPIQRDGGQMLNRGQTLWGLSVLREQTP